jgi:tight adherence protein B
MSLFISMLLTTGSVAGAVLAPWVLIRKWWERQNARLQSRLESPQEEAPLRPLARPNQRSTGWSARLDEKFEQTIERGGGGLKSDQALAIICLCAVTLAGLFFLWRLEMWATGIGLLLGVALPLAIFLFLHSRWRLQAQNQLPDVYFLLARSLRAGLSLEQALTVVSEYGSPPLAEEFRRCVRHMQLSLPAPAALQLVAQRLKLPDFDAFLALVTLHRTTGGNLAALLDRLATGTRDRNQFRGYFRAATALGRITSFCIGGAVPVLLLVYSIWQPDYLAKFFLTPSGTTAFFAAMILEVVGVIWLAWLLRVNY